MRIYVIAKNSPNSHVEPQESDAINQLNRHYHSLY